MTADLETHGIIQLSISTWARLIVLVPKTDPQDFV